MLSGQREHVSSPHPQSGSENSHGAKCASPSQQPGATSWHENPRTPSEYPDVSSSHAPQYHFQDPSRRISGEEERLNEVSSAEVLLRERFGVRLRLQERSACRREWADMRCRRLQRCQALLRLPWRASLG